MENVTTVQEKPIPAITPMQPVSSTASRIASVDVYRGFVMLLMMAEV